MIALKLLSTRCRIFSTINTRERLADGLHPDPLEELKRSPRPPSHKKGRGRRKGRERKGGKECGSAVKGRLKGKEWWGRCP